MSEEKKSLFKPLPIFSAVICIAIIIAYVVYIYTNGQEQKKLTTFLENAFTSKVKIKNFEYSPISDNLKINNLTIFFRNDEKTALKIKNIRASIKNIKKDSAVIENMTISGINIYTYRHDANDIVELFKIPAEKLKDKNEKSYNLIVNNINIKEATLYAPAIDDETKMVSFQLPAIVVSDIGTGDYKAVLATILEATNKNINRIILKHKISYKLKGGKIQLEMLRNLARNQAKKQLDRIDKELENTNKMLKEQINNLGNNLSDSINSLRNELQNKDIK